MPIPAEREDGRKNPDKTPKTSIITEIYGQETFRKIYKTLGIIPLDEISDHGIRERWISPPFLEVTLDVDFGLKINYGKTTELTDCGVILKPRQREVTIVEPVTEIGSSIEIVECITLSPTSLSRQRYKIEHGEGNCPETVLNLAREARATRKAREDREYQKSFVRKST